MLAVLLTTPIIGYIIYVAVPGSSLFSWHPICMSISFAGMMLGGAEVFSLGSQRYRHRVTLHWQLQAAAAVLSLAGLAAIFFNKELRGAPHFTSTHGQLGLAAVAAATVQSAGGLLALYATRLPRLVAPRLTKTLHAMSGVVLVALGLYTLRLGLATAWFQLVAAPLAQPVGELLLALAVLRVTYRVVMFRFRRVKSS
ncbi:cytochrome b561 domain-containing protein 2-like [Pollicipes pollicipes]|uniref:cytochrome b561 domain-containing protein 2-like n=1 Tax=Pollicipes pollicipes TaxID=41117 RepID=UPI001884CAB8|nr:cytochrome b561 domain-containing protein 2-like [Pollicipes pollicipes]XP_037088250.1 cytochrome b561 domain-containing protein 2-like [Pollicipes pollicipes]XP_037088251.1 cytochrome b561 domain-containing protein 2-like [Pollicipes pollicipes]XP_037088252.1 cytochrome b561 domain-containing protein 2-like [Pollicipes pollicipes]